MGVKWGHKRTKVDMTVYVQPEVKQGIKLAATLGDTTMSKLVEDLCRDYLSHCPAVQKALREGG